MRRYLSERQNGNQFAISNLLSLLIATLALVFPGFPQVTEPAASDWPQWRGHNGSGISRETGLPEHWGPKSAEIQWRTAIPGKARSSPIVSGDRIFLTSASPDMRIGRMVDLLTLLLVGSAMLLLTWTTEPGSTASRRISIGSYLEGFKSSAASMGWLLFACVVASCLVNDVELANRPIGPFRPIPVLILLLGVAVVFSSRFGDTLHVRMRWPSSGISLALFASTASILYVAHAPSRYVYLAACFALIQPLVWRLDSTQQAPGLLLRFETPLRKYTTLVFLTIVCITSLSPSLFWPESSDANIWARAGVISLIGLVSAVGWLRADSCPRFIGSVTLLCAACLLFHYAPLTGTVAAGPVHQHSDVPYTVWKRGLAVSPGIVGAVWHAAVFLLSRRRRTTDLVPRQNQWIAGSLTALAIVVLVRATIAFPSNARMAFTLMSVNAQSGSVFWETVVSRGPLGRIDDYRGNGTSPTPATDGKLVFAHFGSVTACLDFKGKILWNHTDAQYPSSVVYGATSSPIVADDRLIVVQDRERSEQVKRSYVAAYQKSSGQILWRVEPPDARNSYGTPLALGASQPPTLLTITSRALLAYDLRNGNRLWSVPAPVEEIVTSMVMGRDRLYISGGSFAAVTMALRLHENSNALAPEVLWSTSRSVKMCASPVFYDGMLFTLSQNGIASCYDGDTGGLHWRRRLAPGEYFASLTAADGKIYASNQDGVTTVFEACARFNIVAQNDLGESIYASPAISRGSIILRTDKALYCIRQDKNE